jgi:hypothetical protein
MSDIKISSKTQLILVDKLGEILNVLESHDSFKDKLVLTQDLVEDLFNKIRYIKPTIND